MLPQGQTPVYETGVLELVGINDQIDQNDYGDEASATVSVNGQPISGTITQWTLISTEDGSGSVQAPSCEVYVFDAATSTAAGDTAVTAGEWPTAIGVLSVSPSDWKGDTNGKIATITDQDLWFHPVTALKFVFKNLSATGINDAAGDDEQIEMNAWYVRWS